MNSGQQVVEWLFSEQLQVDSKWSLRIRDGFHWWAGRQQQTVQVIGEEPMPDGSVGQRVSVRTELLRDVVLDERSLRAINSLLMSFAALTGPVYDETTRTLSLCSMVRVHSDVAGWVRKPLGVAAVLQLVEASALKPQLAAAMGGELAVSGHPYSGMREEPDELLGFVEAVLRPTGRAPGKTGEREFREAAERFGDTAPSAGAAAEGGRLTAEFSFGRTTSLCQLFGDKKDSRYGNGLTLLQTFRVPDVSVPEGARLALALNQAELTGSPFGYGLGSYFCESGMLRFRSLPERALPARAASQSLPVVRGAVGPGVRRDDERRLSLVE